MIGASFDSTKTPLQELLKQAGEGKLQLPDFQRGWVWDDERIRSLLTSISGFFPIGAVMLLQTGGENVRPEEVEAVLRAHPRVADAAVAGRPDPLWGEIVAAWVVADGTPDAELDRWCRERLAPSKVPRRWSFVDRLPRSEGGKLLRRQLG